MYIYLYNYIYIQQPAAKNLFLYVAMVKKNIDSELAWYTIDRFSNLSQLKKEI